MLAVNDSFGARDAAASAALARSGHPVNVPQPLLLSSDIQEKIKFFNKALQLVPDLLHHRPQHIQEALRVVQGVCQKAQHKLRTQDAAELRVNVVKFEKKAHGIAHCDPALCRLGFREKVLPLADWPMDQFVRFAVYEGTFQDATAEESFLAHALAAIDQCIADAEKHCQGVDRAAKAAAEERQRQRTLGQIEQDRINVLRRTMAARLASQRIQSQSERLPVSGAQRLAYQ